MLLVDGCPTKEIAEASSKEALKTVYPKLTTGFGPKEVRLVSTCVEDV